MAFEITETTIISRAPNTAFRELEGKMFIVGATSTKLVMLNPTGTKVWSYLDEPLALGGIADRLCQEFEVERDVALQDATTFVESLLSRELLQLETD